MVIVLINIFQISGFSEDDKILTADKKHSEKQILYIQFCKIYYLKDLNVGTVFMFESLYISNAKLMDSL